MCGIAGVCNLNGEPVSATLLKRMSDSLAHRGPDGDGQFAEGPIGLGHRRLAVIDLSVAARQPMMSSCGRYVLIYNGEIYNFQELRMELEAKGYWFRSRTDTEVVLNAFVEWQEQALDRLNGMFAFAVWDRRLRRLFLARDRYGVKPLYWCHRNGVFIFGSEIKAILEHPHVSRAVCHEALNEYFTFQNIFSDVTLFEGVRLLPPGSTLTLEADSTSGPQTRRYWDFPCGNEASEMPEEEWAERLYDHFVHAVTKQLVSDVPLGAYLSGGMDSGSITSVAVRNLPRLVTFTGGFDLTSASGLELGFDERQGAEILSNLCKTEHYEVVMHAGDMECVMPELIWHLEDLRVGQCYPNYYVARLASKFVKVVLSGIGGDELFGGYPWRYFRGINSHHREDYYQRNYSFWQRLVPDEDKPRLFNEPTMRTINGHSTFDVFRRVYEGWTGPLKTNDDFINASLYFELKTFLPGLFIVEDKLSMAHSLETRVPFLDNELVELALRIPIRYRVRDLDHPVRVDENQPGKRLLYEMGMRNGKTVLRKAMGRLIPKEITERTKQGFSAPDASWFRGESIDYINRLLRSPKARLYDYLTPEYVHAVLDDHCAGRVNHRLLIWSFLSVEWWLRQFLPV